MFSHQTSYLLPKLEGYSRSQGDRGIFASQPIKSGEVVAVWGGEIVMSQDLIRLPLEKQRIGVQVEEGLYLIPAHEGPGDWVNHSCEPNAGMNGQIAVVARRDIAPGEEVCIDYAMVDCTPYDEFECLCGAPTCRGYITGNDWRQPELQNRYEGYFSSYLQRRIARLTAPG